MQHHREFILNMLDAELEKLHLILKTMPEEILSKSHAPGKWSPKQLLHHLMLSERQSMQAAERYYNKGSGARKAGLGATIRSGLLTLSLSSPLKFKSPDVVRADDHNINTTSLKDIFTDWKMQRRSLRESIFRFAEEDMRRLYYKHPVVGTLSVYQMLHFFKVHFKRHAKQALYAANQNLREPTNTRS